MADFFRKYARYFWFVVVTLVTVGAFYTWRELLLPFVIGLALAYLLLPLVRWVDSHLPWQAPRWRGVSRVVAIVIVVIVLLAVVGLFIYYAASAVADSLAGLIENASSFIDTAVARIQSLFETLNDRLPEEWRQRLENAISGLGDTVGGALQGILSGGGSVISGSIGVIFSFAALPLFLFYLLKDAERIKAGIFGAMGSHASVHARHILGIIERTLGRYFRAQLILGAVVGTLTLIGLLFIAPTVAIPLALINGVLEVVPTFGPIIGGIIMTVVILAVAPDRILWVIALAFAVQLLENNVLVPRIQAANLKLHPALVLFLLVAGSYFWGFWGLVFVVPMVATLTDIFKYVNAMHDRVLTPDEVTSASQARRVKKVAPPSN
jgi:predicted PurR-regulated permease PerM